MSQDDRRVLGRRRFLGAAGKGGAVLLASQWLGSIERALAIPPARDKGTIEDVQHVVILMQENRSFDHYFGTMSGVRGFGDRSTITLPSGKPVWWQSDGQREILPFHLDTQSTTAMRVPGTPHSWPDAQLAWDLGRFGNWPRYKYFQSMGYYQAADIPFQRALAEAFTLCDAHHCSIQTGTLANRAVFMTGTNVRPGLDKVADNYYDAMIDNANNRGLNVGPYSWTTYPERLEAAGVSWRIYQDPANNWGGLLAPWEAFVQYQTARPGDPLFERAMRRWTLDDLSEHVSKGELPQVSWIIPSPVWSEHPAESSPLQGASYTQQVLDCLTSNPELWSRTVFIITFDENDGFFDHVPPPAVPAFNPDGSPAGKTSLAESIDCEYFNNAIDAVTATRPYGLGPRVPMYIVSPWSRGGWVNSQVFDHTSTIRFLEARFGVFEPNITPWHRVVTGDLTSCFDFEAADAELPELPDMSSARGETLTLQGDPVRVPDMQELPAQDAGVRYSRALPYELHAHARRSPSEARLTLDFENQGAAGAVFHVYDRQRPERLPRRYTVEAGKMLSDDWDLSADRGRYDLQVIAPNGWQRIFQGVVDPRQANSRPLPEVRLMYHAEWDELELMAWNESPIACVLRVTPHVYRQDVLWRLELPPLSHGENRRWSIESNGNWYDFRVTADGLDGWSRHFAGRLENGRPSITDPALSRPRRWPRMW